MKSYLRIKVDRKSREVEIHARLMPNEVTELAFIRHFIVEHITEIIQPGCERISFKLLKEEAK